MEEFTDAWGNVLSISGMYANTLGQDNPIRYRGYYYDFETDFYYLQSRYYDPAMGRFINADGYINANGDMLGFNMFAYCSNNPVMYLDYSGQFAILGIALTSDTLFKIITSVIIAIAAIDAISSAQSSDGITIFPPVSVPEFRKKELSVPIPKVQEKEKDITIHPPANGTTYYHVTSRENALNIISTGILMGSRYEGGYVFAWKIRPDKKAVCASGAYNNEVIIAFETQAPFERDPGIRNVHALRFLPVRSVMPGPVFVRNVRIVG